jgi:spore germination cell wall hydrolase CwlJ-like protein
MKWLLVVLIAVTTTLGTPALIKERPLTKKEISCLAINIYHEARGESKKGQLLVAAVTLNRMRDSRWPNNVCRVVYQRSQFSWTLDKTKTITVPNQYYLVALESLNYNTKALYYHALHVKPKWSARLTKTYTVGSHIFYTDKT